MKKIFFTIVICSLLKQVAAQFTNEFQTFNSTNTPVFTGNNFKCVGIGKFGQIWAGTQYQGLYWFDTATKAWTKSANLTNVFINQIQKDTYGAIWVAQSGTLGQSGGGSNTAGGVNYFPNRTDAAMQFFSTGNFLSSRNVRGIYIDTFNTAPTNIKRLWVPQATFITSGNTAAGGFSKWQDSSTGNFQKLYLGLQVFPNTNIVSAGTPSCYAACGNKKEVWIATETNYVIASGSTSQIQRYDAITGQYLGGYDQNGAFDNTRLYYQDQARVYIDKSTKGVLQTGFRVTAMYVDEEDRRWIGLRNGGVVVKIGNTWKAVNMPSVFPSGTMVNFNAITSDEFGYVYIGTNNGLVVYDNGADVTDSTAYTRLTTLDTLPSNNITGLAYDKAAGRMIITSDAGVTFWKVKYKIDVRMKWDFSFPYNKASQPVGVAADGVSRIYLKIKKRSDAPFNIKSLIVKLKDFNAARANTRGKLKKPLVIDRYSEEANTGTTDSVNVLPLEARPGLAGEYWIWYKSPEDFSNDSLSAYAKLRRRYDTLTIIATYENNTKDTMEYKIGIVRPPTLLVHGLASAPVAWDSLKHPYFGANITFLNSPLFTYKRAIKMDPIGVFQKNGAQLLGGDLSTYGYTDDRLNTLQGNLDAIREMRYAANQVDYVCHSMGGIMIRTAIGMYPKKFYAKAGDPYQYKTYGEGFVHKILTLNTPHNGSPVADIGFKIAPLFPKEILPAINLLYAAQTELIGGFIKPVGTGGRLFGTYAVTDAVYNLQVSEKNGGVKMLQTNAKNHLLTSNVNWVEYSQGVDKLEGILSSLYNSFIQTLIAATYFAIPLEIFSDTPERVRGDLLQLLAEQPQTRMAHFLNRFALNRGYANYMSYSDLIVPMQSQTARQNENVLPNISNVLGNDSIAIKIPIPIFTYVNGLPLLLHTFYKTVYLYGLNGNHSAVLSRVDVGKKVFDLLNTKRTNNAFGDVIPANTDIEPTVFYRADKNVNKQKAANIQSVTQSFYDTTKVKIDNPLRNGNVLADSIFQIKFRIKDTTKLLYYVVNYQVSDSFRLNKSVAQQAIFFSSNPSFQNNNIITLMAVYTNALNNGVDYYIDTLSVNATNLAPLQGFRINEDVVEIKVGELYYPIYEAKYGNNWVRLPFNDTAISTTIDLLNVLKFDTLSKACIGQSSGGAIANFTYKGFADSLLFRVYEPYNSNCINRSIASGNCSNPAIWSKGTVPDICDSVIISSTHIVTLDTSITIKALRISSGGTLTINNASDTLQIGELDEHFTNTDIYGTLALSNGGLNSNGRVKLNASSTFSMSGGKITIDANSGIKEMSIVDGIALFEAASGMAAFNFSGGTLQINNPPYGSISQTINCPYDFGSSTTLILGINAPTIASKNVNGFGGLLFPNKIGKLIINAGGRTGNRQFVNKKALTVKGSAEVKTGSGIILQAPLNVQQ